MSKSKMWEADYRKAAKELTKLKADVARLRGALLPFAAKGIALDLPGHFQYLDADTTKVTIGSCRNAACALEETK